MNDNLDRSGRDLSKDESGSSNGDLGPMFEHDKIITPVFISRNAFIRILWVLPTSYKHALDTTMLAVELAERFLKDNKTEDAQYCKELAYAVTVIAAKVNEDYGYDNINKAVFDCNNSYVKELEWRICDRLNYSFQTRNFASFVAFHLTEFHLTGTTYFKMGINSLGVDFKYLFTYISLHPTLLTVNPFTILLALKLISNKRYKQNKCLCHIFWTARDATLGALFETISRRYKLPLEKVIRAYITVKRKRWC